MQKGGRLGEMAGMTVAEISNFLIVNLFNG